MSESNGNGGYVPTAVRRCPTCNERLQATLILHASEIVVVDGRIDQWQPGFGRDLEQSVVVDDERVNLTCPNNHDCNDLLVAH